MLRNKKSQKEKSCVEFINRQAAKSTHFVNFDFDFHKIIVFTMILEDMNV